MYFASDPLKGLALLFRQVKFPTAFLKQVDGVFPHELVSGFLKKFPGGYQVVNGFFTFF